jgi:hypothetical protein
LIKTGKCPEVGLAPDFDDLALKAHGYVLAAVPLIKDAGGRKADRSSFSRAVRLVDQVDGEGVTNEEPAGNVVISHGTRVAARKTGFVP